jgi:hypothetical protein
MTRRMSQQRQDVLDLVRREGSVTPKRLSVVLGLKAGSARKLLFAMLSDDQLRSPARGVYELPDEETLPGGGDVTEGAPDVTEGVTETEESSEGMPILGESPSGTYVYSHNLNAMLPRERVRSEKGYR